MFFRLLNYFFYRFNSSTLYRFIVEALKK